MQNTIDKFYSKPLRKKLLLIQLLLLFVPNIQLFSIQTDNGSIPASLCYFFSVVFIPCLLSGFNRMKLPPWYITALYGYVILWAIFRAPQYGLSKSILHWIFGFYLLVVLLNVGRDLTRDEWTGLLEAAFCIFAVVHFLFTVTKNHELVGILLKGYYSGAFSGVPACHLTSLTRGGRNLDATWLGLGAFFLHGKKKAVYVTWAILFSFLGSSRVGVLAIGMAVLWNLIYDPIYRLTRRSFKWYALYAVVLLALLFGSGMAQAFLQRSLVKIPAPGEVIASFAQEELPRGTAGETAINKTIEEGKEGNVEAFLSGRAAMWQSVPWMMRENPWGYGVGNAVRVMRSDFGFTGTEDVVHNVLMQWSLDEGILGGLWYLGLVAALFISQWKKRPACFADPFAAYLLGYLVLSLVQFHGGEALMIYVLGIALMQWHTKLICFGDRFSKLQAAVMHKTRSKT